MFASQEVPEALVDYWLAWVTKVPICPQVDSVVEGVQLEGKKDAYLQVQYLEYVGDTPAGGRKFSKEDCPPNNIFDCGIVVQCKVGKLPDGKTDFHITSTVHQNILARLQYRTG